MIDPDKWRPADGLRLEPNALSAIRETTRNLALTAGPGAGKTEMLAQRADFLLRTGVCYFPNRILAISFKVDASSNLKERVRRRCGELATRLDSHTFHAFAKRLIDRFRPVLTNANALDADYSVGAQRVHKRQITFQDMVPLAIEILESSSVARNAVRQAYSHVFLDEFQDCTDAQYNLIRAAFAGTDVQITAVGDTKQRIMVWAGALVGAFEIFGAEFDVRSLNLYQNFRSQLRLRRMHNAMVKVMDPPAAVEDQELSGGGGIVEVLPFDSSFEEARALAHRIKGWIEDEGLPPSEIAVLVSRQVELYASHLISELQNLGVPYRNEQELQDISTEPAARLLVDFLLLVVGQREHDAYTRLMEAVLDRTLDDEAEYRLRRSWHEFFEYARSQLEAQVGNLNAVVAQLAQEFVKIAGRGAIIGLSSDYERGSRLEEVISETVARISELLIVNQDPLQALRRFSDDGAVRIMTIHKSKGLEFDTVVVLGVERETFWGELDAERSTYFVAISRAKDRLYLTTCQQRPKPEGANKYWRERRSPQIEFLGYASSTV